MQRANVIRLLTFLSFFVLIGLIWVRPTFGIFVTNGHTTVDQRNTVGANTGGNTTSNGSVETGSAESQSIIDTTVNTTVISCCETPKPTHKPTTTPTTPVLTPTPTAAQSTPTPTRETGSGGGNGGSSGGSSGSNTGGTSVNVKTPEGEVLGLSTTSSGFPITDVTTGFGLVCIGIGMYLTNRRIGI